MADQVRLVGVTIHPELMLDAGDGSDLRPLPVQAFRLSPTEARRFDIAAVVADAQAQVDAQEEQIRQEVDSVAENGFS